ncbi:MAG: hypothetical protein LBS28_00065 [Streptococcaceae bacterium]|jgi:hypothetical protein|nr:hypothetical protein [Streptococcaceae bacterium]
MKHVKIYLILLLSFICFGQPSNVFGKSWIDGDLDQLFNSESSGIVYNNLLGFELETNKIGVADQKLSNAYFEMIKLENYDIGGNIINNFTDDDHFVIYQNQVKGNVQQRSVAKTNVSGKLIFNKLHKISSNFPYNYALSQIGEPSIFHSNSKNDLLAENNNANNYMDMINTNTEVAFEIGFYLVHEIWAPIGDFTPENSQTQIFRRYDKTDTVWLIHLFVDSNGNPKAEYKAGKFIEHNIDDFVYYTLHEEKGLSSLPLSLDEKIKATLENINNTLHPEYGFKITKKNPAGEIITSKAEFALAKIPQTKLEDLRTTLSNIQKGIETNLPTDEFIIQPVGNQQTENGILNFDTLDKSNIYVIYEHKAPSGYHLDKKTAYLVYFDSSESYALTKSSGAPIVFKGEIKRDEDDVVSAFIFKNAMDSQFQLRPISFNFFDHEIEDFICYIPRYYQDMIDGVEEWEEFDIAKYLQKLNNHVEKKGYTFELTNTYQIEVKSNGYIVSNIQEIITSTLMNEDNYSIITQGIPPDVENWVDISYNWLSKKVLNENNQFLTEYLRDPNSYIVNIDFENKAQPNGFLPSTGKIFTKPIVLILMGVIIAIIALSIYKFAYLRDDEL